jgi:peptidoglycan L-alanyl-D-glutamate endopeptidase CwlK
MSPRVTKRFISIYVGGCVQIWWLMGGVFLLVCGAVGALAFPSWRRMWRAPARSPAGKSGAGLHWHRRPGTWGAIGLALVLMPAGMSWWLSQHGTRQLDGYDDTVATSDAHLAALLEGEHLAPPPPLPPDVFLTQELAQERPLLASADRRWEQLDAEFVQRVLRVFKVMRDQHGYDMALLEGYRSPERQALLAAQGAQVTQAGAWQSYHQHGLAVDCAFLREGKLVISERDPWAMRGYQLFGETAEQIGLTWGGRWKMLDLGHTEWRKPGVKLGLPPALASAR